jgi:hypothetical protein
MGSFRRSAQATGAALGAWFIIFIPMFFAGGEMFEGDPPPWWAWPSVGVAALACGAFAWSVRRRSPVGAAGMWTGVALGLLHAGLCFSGS